MMPLGGSSDGSTAARQQLQVHGIEECCGDAWAELAEDASE